MVVAASAVDACSATGLDADGDVGSTHSSGDAARSGSAGVADAGSEPARLSLDAASRAADASSVDVATFDGVNCSTNSDCPALESATDFTADVGNFVPAQSVCDGAEQPVGCPVSIPERGSPCATAGLRCTYRVDSDAVTLSTCQQLATTLGWAQDGYICHESCQLSDSGAPDGAACDCAGEIPCDVNPYQTNQQLADSVVGEAYSCCNVPPETTLEVTLSGGCVTSVNTSFGDTSAACARRLLMGHRISCAANLSCASYLVSTLP